MVNLTALENLTPPDINISIVNDTTQIVPNLIANTNTLSDGWFGLLVMIGIFIWLFWLLFDDAGRFRLDIVKTLVFSSGITCIVGIIMLVTGLSTSFNHLMWFGTLFIISLIISFFLKQKGG